MKVFYSKLLLAIVSLFAFILLSEVGIADPLVFESLSYRTDAAG